MTNGKGLTKLEKRAIKKQNRLQAQGNPAPVQRGVSAIGLSYRSGPLPSAKELAEYDAVAPGTAQIIVSKFAQQTDHRVDLESTVVKGNDRRSDRGQWMAYSIAMTAVVGGIVLIALGKPTGGFVAIITAITGLVAVFITGKVFQWKERQAKQGGS